MTYVNTYNTKDLSKYSLYEIITSNADEICKPSSIMDVFS